MPVVSGRGLANRLMSNLCRCVGFGLIRGGYADAAECLPTNSKASRADRLVRGRGGRRGGVQQVQCSARRVPTPWNDPPAILFETENARRDGGDAEPPEAAPSTSRAESDILVDRL
jgi:hypothetical protein